MCIVKATGFIPESAHHPFYTPNNNPCQRHREGYIQPIRRKEIPVSWRNPGRSYSVLGTQCRWQSEMSEGAC